MFNLSSIYTPITAQNPHAGNSYHPCEPLRPYIATFWGTEAPQFELPAEGKPVLVIPDTCSDIIFEMDYRTNRFSAHYHGINDRPFMASSVVETTLYSCFAIRFHFWAVHLFADDWLTDSLNISIESGSYFHGWDSFFEEMMSKTRTLQERIPLAEQFLLSKLKRNKSNDNLLNAAYRILRTNGSGSIKDVCSYTAVSQRQIERLFLQRVGLPMKKLSNLVRYQRVWQDIVYSPSGFDIQDAVAKYGYTDQAHLLNEFKRYHGLTPHQAQKLAFMLP